ncbi:MAG: DUF2809 domain-containing protein [Planctomycetota bacterium]|nr:MAG: DUF2809 domain-containing protein [Planctomycetota bacterium]
MSRAFNSYLSRRLAIILSLCVITPAGFACKFYAGPGGGWFNDYGGGVAYEIFWCLVVFFFWPEKKAAVKIAVWVFIVTCLLETLQLWHPPFLRQIRSTFPGKALLGTTFAWWDFPHYVIGTFLGWLWMRALGRNHD